MNNNRIQRERGVALVIVLGLVALIAAWASTAAYEDMITLRRSENMQDAMRSAQGSFSAMMLAIRILKEDAQNAPQQDDLDEIWAQKMTAFPVDQGMVSGEIVDTNRYLNLNDLVNPGGAVEPEMEKSIKLLFQRLDIDVALVDRVIDWIDPNDTPHGSGGMEASGYYDRSYSVKNRALERWSELHLIAGFDDEIIKKLEPYCSVRPAAAGGKTAININTASAEVLRALFPQMSVADAEAFIEQRPYSSVNINHQPWAAGVVLSPGRLSIASDLFMVRTDARFGRTVVRELFLISRSNNSIRLISRERLEWNRA